MKWMNQIAVSALIFGLAPLAAVAEDAAEKASAPAQESMDLRGVDGSVTEASKHIVVAHVVDPGLTQAADAANESVDISKEDNDNTLYTDDLFNDDVVAEKGLAAEAGWNIQVAER